MVGEVAAGLMAAVARQSLPDRALLERVAVDVIQEELKQEMGAGPEPGQAVRRGACRQQGVGLQQGLPSSRSVLTGAACLHVWGLSHSSPITHGHQHTLDPMCR